MKNLTLLASCTDVIGYARDHWKTDVFRRLQDEPGSYLQHYIDLFAGNPRIFYDMDDAELERNHFTVWMNAIQRRDGYTNPYLEDMYNLHEIVHAVDMTYDSHSTPFDWSVRSLVNELKATIETEVVLYFAIPGLRAHTFPFEIWADRFLDNRVLLSPRHPTNQAFFAADPDGFRNTLLKKRWDIRHGPTPGDPIEGMIHGYVARNDEWDRIWAECFPEIDGHMEEFEVRCRRNRTDAIRWHADWLLRKKGAGACPFQTQAAEYVRVAADFKRRFATQTVEAAQRADGGMSTV
ncbi:MAG TPA: hypothetical protein VM597_25690 [Gemmataceae bacterium]|jgi:hypothetical protein|nr:hypothetical protein [Gemmataceae bacterium]